MQPPAAVLANGLGLPYGVQPQARATTQAVIIAAGAFGHTCVFELDRLAIKELGRVGGLNTNHVQCSKGALRDNPQAICCVVELHIV
jgi:hypothetical protein